MDTLLGYWIVMCGIYLIPTLIAVCNGSRNAVGVILLNLLAGWTIVGWFIALIWALSGPKEAS